MSITFETGAVTVDDVLRAVEKLKAVPKNKKWIIVNPEGQMMIGEYQEVSPYFMSQHPYLTGIGFGYRSKYD